MTPTTPTPPASDNPARFAPIPVDHGELQLSFIPVIEGDDDDDAEEEPRPAFFCWSLPDMCREEVASRLAAWGAPISPRTLQRTSARLVVPIRRPRHKFPELTTCEVPGYRLDLLDGIQALVALAAANGGGRSAPSASVVTWSLAVKLALELVSREQLVPVLRGTPGDRRAWARWAAAVVYQSDRERFETIAGAMPLSACAPELPAVLMSSGVDPDADADAVRGDEDDARRDTDTPVSWRPRELLRSCLDAIVDLLVRRALLAAGAAEEEGNDAEPADPRRIIARRPGPWEERFATALTTDRPLIIPYGLGESRLIEELARWARPALGAGHADLRACLRLDAPASADSNEWRLSYFLQSAADPQQMMAAAKVWSSPADRLRLGRQIVNAPQECLLRDLAEAAHVFVPIGDSLDEAHPTGLELTPAEAWVFLSEAAPVLEQAGLGVLVPATLSDAGRRRLRARLRVTGASPGAGGGAVPGGGVVPGGGAVPVGGAAPGVGAMPGGGSVSSTIPGGGDGGVAAADEQEGIATTVNLGPDALADFRWEAAIGDDTLTPEQFRELTALKQPLVRWRDEWVVVEPGIVTELRTLLGKPQQTGMSSAVALAALLSGTAQTPRGRAVNVVASQDLAATIDQLRDRGFPAVRVAKEFCGKLRPYQRRGLRWLAGMADLGLGTCLADDMGLGKTIQLIAQLLHHRRTRPDDPRAALVICPTSVLGNWQREIERFAPVLPVIRHHGIDRARSATALGRQIEPHAVVLTTYALARRDIAFLRKVEWSHAVLDEAQNVKNPQAQQARAVRTLRAGQRVALTGTPVENRLAELWSIFEFLNPGLLGPLDRFRRHVAIPVERYRDPEATERLRRLTGPFLLRRLKTDPRVIRDLPEKLEMKVHCTLTREQAALYQAALDELMMRIETSQGMSRRGLILKLITELKQICNHPAHFGRETGPLPNRSGKLDQLLSMLDVARAEGDRSLVYTQYREMGKLLVSAVQTALDVEVPFLHGGVPPRKRDEMVARFQEEGDAAPIFILSLKAGGTGLNLTAANRVFHFDRWWNPAVEDQATDRAHRIGQTRQVQVHKMVTIGTLEERIDRMLIEKRDLADRVVGVGEHWLTEMSDNELRQLFQLGGEAVVEGGEGGNGGDAAGGGDEVAGGGVAASGGMAAGGGEVAGGRDATAGGGDAAFGSRLSPLRSVTAPPGDDTEGVD